MNAVLKNAAFTGLQALPAGLLQRLAQGALFPYYHLVAQQPSLYTGQAYPMATPEVFERNIDYLLRHWKPISLQELIHSINTTGSAPVNSFHLTFDDGFREVYEVIFPILQRKGVPATTFLCSDLLREGVWMWENKRSLLTELVKNSTKVQLAEICRMLHCPQQGWLAALAGVSYTGREVLDAIGLVLEVDFPALAIQYQPYLSVGQVQTMIQSGYTFGSHSLDHPLFQALSPDRQLEQIKESVDSIQTQFGLDYRVFAFPYGEFDLAPKLFNTIFDLGLTDLCFGTRGMIPDEFPRVVQRLWLEAQDFCTDRIIRQELALRVIRKAVHNNLVTRR